MYSLTLGSIFAGVGGFDLGFRNIGFKTSWMIEWDTNCQHILRRHFPESQLLGDVKGISAKKLSYVDVATFGSPCQDMSHAGKRSGISGSRSSMFFEAMRILKEINPKVIIWENVFGSLTSNNGNDFARVIENLAYGNRRVAYRVLDSQYFGVPQRRKRVFAVSCTQDLDPRKILDIKNHTTKIEDIDKKKCLFSIQDVRSLDKKQNGKGWSDANVSYTLDTKATQGIAARISKTSIGFKPGQSSSARTDGSMFEICPTLETCGGGNNKPAIAIAENESCVVRRITPLESERLQGFPDEWTKFGFDASKNVVEMSNSSRYSQMGNAVTVNVAEWIAKNVKKEIEINRYVP